MSEVATSAPSTEAATTAQPQTPSAPEIDFSKMTGAEAKAYVEAQKSKASGKQSASSEVAKSVQSSFNQKKEQSPEDKAEEKRVQEEIRKYKVKVSGQEVEVDEKELLRGYSHQQAANKLYQEAQKTKKQAEEFVSMLKDPEKFYEVAAKLGHDPRNLSESYLVKKLEEEMLDPKERELREYKAKWEGVEKEKQRVLEAKYAKDYNDQFVQALQETEVLASKETVAEMATYIRNAAKIGFKMTPKEAAMLVKEDHEKREHAYTRSRLSSLEGDALIKFLGEDVANKLRQYDVSKLKNPEGTLKTPSFDQQVTRKRDDDGGNKRMTPAEWRAYNRR